MGVGDALTAPMAARADANTKPFMFNCYQAVRQTVSSTVVVILMVRIDGNKIPERVEGSQREEVSEAEIINSQAYKLERKEEEKVKGPTTRELEQ